MAFQRELVRRDIMQRIHNNIPISAPLCVGTFPLWPPSRVTDSSRVIDCVIAKPSKEVSILEQHKRVADLMEQNGRRARQVHEYSMEHGAMEEKIAELQAEVVDSEREIEAAVRMGVNWLYLDALPLFMEKQEQCQRYNNLYVTNMNMNENIDILEKRVFGGIIQPFMENANEMAYESDTGESLLWDVETGIHAQEILNYEIDGPRNVTKNDVMMSDTIPGLDLQPQRSPPEIRNDSRNDPKPEVDSQSDVIYFDEPMDLIDECMDANSNLENNQTSPTPENVRRITIPGRDVDFSNDADRDESGMSIGDESLGSGLRTDSITAQTLPRLEVAEQIFLPHEGGDDLNFCGVDSDDGDMADNQDSIEYGGSASNNNVEESDHNVLVDDGNIMNNDHNVSVDVQNIGIVDQNDSADDQNMTDDFQNNQHGDADSNDFLLNGNNNNNVPDLHYSTDIDFAIEEGIEDNSHDAIFEAEYFLDWVLLNMPDCDYNQDDINATSAFVTDTMVNIELFDTKTVPENLAYDMLSECSFVYTDEFPMKGGTPVNKNEAAHEARDYSLNESCESNIGTFDEIEESRVAMPTGDLTDKNGSNLDVESWVSSIPTDDTAVMIRASGNLRNVSCCVII